MAYINILDKNTIDKIAAGEVVERPLNVVKELTENAMDAGATAITCEIKNGGKSLIRITDNGSGIEKDQIKKAFLRHATSKISNADDLFNIVSLGFRGEAISSIAAVSYVECITKTEESLTGLRYVCEGGQEISCDEVGAPNGTTFIVKNLFYNVPARLKFLKSDITEAGYVTDMMEHLALSHPNISFRVVDNGKERFQTSGNGNLEDVIYRIYGRETNDRLLDFEYEDDSFSVKGFIGKPELNLPTRRCECFFVNGRYVSNNMIINALEGGYKNFLMQHKFPFAILMFEVEPNMVDVNVHPSKMEIRLIEGEKIYESLLLAVKERLGRVELIPEVKLIEDDKNGKKADSDSDSDSDSNGGKKSVRSPEIFETKRLSLISKVKGLNETNNCNTRVEVARDYSREVLNEVQTNVINEFSQEVQHESSEDFSKDVSEDIPKGVSEEVADRITANVFEPGNEANVKAEQINLFKDNFLSVEAKENYTILGQIFKTYWLIAFSDKLYIMDQHAAHEKVKYERLVKQLKDKEILTQQVNPPIVVDLTGKQQAVVKEYGKQFEMMGFEIEDFGLGSVAIRSMPIDLYGCNETEFFKDILDEMVENPIKGNFDVILEKIASMACKAAVKGNMNMTFEEVSVLLDELLTLDNPYNCPHGRPTIISMSKYEIEKKFKRIV